MKQKVFCLTITLTFCLILCAAFSPALAKTPKITSVPGCTAGSCGTEQTVIIPKKSSSPQTGDTTPSPTGFIIVGAAAAGVLVGIIIWNRNRK